MPQSGGKSTYPHVRFSRTNSSINCRSERMLWNVCTSSARQLLGRDRRSAGPGVERGNPASRVQRFIGGAIDQAKRVIAGDLALRLHVAEKSVPSMIVATHSKLPLVVDPTHYRIRYACIAARGFSAGC
jgi:hypothetical protein